MTSPREKVNEIDGMQEELTTTFSRISEVKVTIAKHMQGASPEARQELTKQLASATQSETNLRSSKTAAMAFAQEGKEKVLIFNFAEFSFFSLPPPGVLLRPPKPQRQLGGGQRGKSRVSARVWGRVFPAPPEIQKILQI